jgi:hypothetical protein
MASESDEDAQAERQLQMSLQLAAEISTSFIQSEASKDQFRSLNRADGLGCARKTFSSTRAQFPQTHDAFFPPQSCERSRFPRPADTIKPNSSDQSDTRSPHPANAGMFTEIPRMTLVSRSWNLSNLYGAKSEASSGLMGLCFETKQQGTNSRQDSNINNISYAAPPMPSATRVAVAKPAAPLSNVLTEQIPPSLTNPWSTFATSTSLGSFTKPKVSSVFRCGEHRAKGTTTGAEGAKTTKVNKACPSLPNEAVVRLQNIGTIQLQVGSAGVLVDDYTSYVPAPQSPASSTDSFKTANEGILADGEEDFNSCGDKDKGSVKGPHPRGLSMISDREAPALAEVLSPPQSGAKAILSRTHEPFDKPQQKQNRKLDAGSNPQEYPITSSVTIESFSTNTIRSAFEGIESLKKRYSHLSRAVPPGKEWLFAWQEITAIFRTSVSYAYFPWKKGFSIQLRTAFKEFRLQGPFPKTAGKDAITKKAVLYVFDGPYFFKKAAPALNGVFFITRLSKVQPLNLVQTFVGRMALPHLFTDSAVTQMVLLHALFASVVSPAYLVTAKKAMPIRRMLRKILPKWP